MKQIQTIRHKKVTAPNNNFDRPNKKKSFKLGAESVCLVCNRKIVITHETDG